MGVLLSRVCPCLGIRGAKVEEIELSTNEYIKQQYELDVLSNDELQTPIKYYFINKRRYYNI